MTLTKLCGKSEHPMFVKSRKSFEEDENQDYLGSLSDVMSGLIFLFIITLTIFALRLQGTRQDLMQELEKAKLENQKLKALQKELIAEKTRLEAIIQQLVGGRSLRNALLESIRKAISEKGFKVEVDLEHGLLRLPEEVLFPSGSDQLQPGGEKMLEVLGGVFAEVLPNYTILASSTGGLASHSLPVVTSASIEAIFIEGHTDNVPCGSSNRFKDNWELSTARGIRTYKALVGFHPILELLSNQAEMPIFSVSGYADRRPVEANDSDEGRQKNRRIDIRLIMTPPKAPPKVIEQIENSLDHGKDEKLKSGSSNE